MHNGGAGARHGWRGTQWRDGCASPRLEGSWHTMAARVRVAATRIVVVHNPPGFGDGKGRLVAKSQSAGKTARARLGTLVVRENGAGVGTVANEFGYLGTAFGRTTRVCPARQSGLTSKIGVEYLDGKCQHLQTGSGASGRCPCARRGCAVRLGTHRDFVRRTSRVCLARGQEGQEAPVQIWCRMPSHKSAKVIGCIETLFGERRGCALRSGTHRDFVRRTSRVCLHAGKSQGLLSCMAPCM